MLVAPCSEGITWWKHTGNLAWQGHLREKDHIYVVIGTWSRPKVDAHLDAVLLWEIPGFALKVTQRGHLIPL